MNKCIVHGCNNHSDQGRFVGKACAPCFQIVSDLHTSKKVSGDEPRIIEIRSKLGFYTTQLLTELKNSGNSKYDPVTRSSDYYQLPMDGTPIVNLVSITDDRSEAWLNSRPNITEVKQSELEDVYRADFGINSMAYVTLQIQSSVLIRELLATFKGCSMWARTSRVLPIKDAKPSQEYIGHLSAKAIYEALQEFNSGVAQDKARLKLPISTSTAYMFATDWRTLVVICKTLRKHAGDVGKFYSNLIWDCITNGTSYNDDLDHYKYDTKDLAITSLTVPANDPSQYASMEYCGTVTTKFRASIGLAAQFARHKLNLYRSSIWEVAKMSYVEHEKIDMTHEIDVITTMPSSSYNTMLSHRAEWLADFGLWSKFVEAGTAHMTDREFFNLLDDPQNYLSDNMERINLTDPGLPDIRLLEAPYLVEERGRREGHNYLLNRWMRLVIMGYIKDNPANELRIRYENNKLAKHLEVEGDNE